VNSYASFQPGGANSGGISFQRWNPSNEGATSSLLYVSKLAPGAAGTGVVVGAFSLDSSGVLYFYPPAAITATPVSITSQPSSQTVNPSASVTFSVTATGDGTLTYQWNKGGVAIGGATSSSYTIPSVAASDAGSYTVVVTGLRGPVTSNAATLTVNNPVTISAQPASQTVNPGASVTFSVTATGAGTLTYQWKKGGTSITNATGSTYTIPSAAETDEASYTVDVTGTAGTVMSSAAALSVNDPVTFSVQPASQAVNPGTSVTFSVTAAGAGTLTYQWKKNGTNITNATSSSYTIASPVESDEGSYTVAVTGTVGAVTSNAAVLSVNDPVVIVASPAARTVNPGVSTTFTVTATGSSLTYQWKKGAATVAGATSSSYTIASPAESDEGSYTVVVTGANGSATSSAAVLTVNDPVVISVQPTAQTTVNPGTSVSFSVTAAGTGTLTYQWKKGGTNIPGATSATYTMPSVVEADEASYTVAVTGTVGTVTSNAAVLTVNDVASIGFSSAFYAGAEAATAAIGDKSYTVTVNRTGSGQGPVTVKVTSSDGSGAKPATAGTDYTAVDQTLSWAAGDTTPKTVTVVVKKDADTTPAETFLLTLSQVTGAAILGANPTAVFTITEAADTVGPVLVVVSPKANAAITTTTVSLETTVTDLISGVASVSASVNGGSAVSVPVNAAVIAGTSYKTNLSGLSNGKNKITLTATDKAGNASTASVIVDLSIADGTAVGAYNGLFTANAEEDTKLSAYVNGPVLNHNGLLHLDVTKGQRFSGTVNMAGTKLSFKGLFLEDGSAVFGDGASASTTLELVKKSGTDDLSLGFLSLQLDAANKKITGTLESDPDELPQVTFASASADQALYADKVNPVPSNFLGSDGKGNYTAVFASKGGTNNGYAVTKYPQGNGFATVNISKAGVVKVVGKLADGTAITYSNALSKTNTFPLYAELYTNKGFITGTIGFDTDQATTDATGADLQWFRPSGFAGTGNYLAGWKKGIAVDFAASRYVPPVTPKTVFQIDGASATSVNNVVIETDGLLADTLNEGSISAANVVTVAAPLTGGAREMKVAFVPATGLLGAVSFKYGPGAAPVTVSGVVLQKSNSASGYFLYTPAAVNPVGQAESGFFEIVKKN